MVLKPSSVSGVSMEAARSNTMVLPADHTPQSCEIALRTVDVNAIEKAVGIRMVYSLKIEGAAHQIPMVRVSSARTVLPGVDRARLIPSASVLETPG
jgi:hypothetical protein